MSESEKLECMVDIETLGNGSNAVILSIGACMFYPTAEGIHSDAFEVFVDPQSCVDRGLKMDPSTVLWWMGKERHEAREVLLGNMEKAVPLRTALQRLSAWFGGDKPVWGNGATFDNVILRNAFMAEGLTPPWMFWNDRCYRTMKNLAPSVKMQRKGVHHSAMWDAISQAEHLQAVNRFITNSGE